MSVKIERMRSSHAISIADVLRGIDGHRTLLRFVQFTKPITPNGRLEPDFAYALLNENNKLGGS